jgi:hypothetical protein
MSKPINTQLADQLRNVVKTDKDVIKYFKGYKKWKAKFEYWFNITKDVGQTLDIIYGRGGSPKHSTGSLYHNSNLDLKSITKRQGKHK